MNRMRHLRRPKVNPESGWFIIGCDCGWSGRTVDMGRETGEIDRSLEQLFRDHLPAGEARTHLMVDTREPETNLTLAQIMDDEPNPKRAAAIFAAQPKIIGTFVMPIGTPCLLLGDRLEDGVHWARFQIGDGPVEELPVGEVRNAQGRVFRLDE